MTSGAQVSGKGLTVERPPQYTGGLGFKPFDPVPDFILLDQCGKARSLNDFTKDGRYVVLVFINSEESKKGMGRTLFESFNAAADDLDAHKAIVVFIDQDDPQTHKRLCEENPSPFPVLSDSDRKVSKKFNVVVGRNIVRSVVLIDQQKRVLRVWEKLDEQEARLVPQKVIAFLEQVNRWAE